MPFNDEEEKIRRANGIAVIRAFRLYFLFGAALALTFPKNVLESFHWVQLLVEFVSAIIPAVARLAAISDMPDVVKVYWTSMWILFPIVTVRVALLWTYSPRILKSNLWTKIKVVVSSLVITVLIGCLVVFFSATSAADLAHVQGRGGAMMRVVTETRIGLAILGGLLFCCFSFLIGVFARLYGIWGANLFRGLVSGEHKDGDQS